VWAVMLQQQMRIGVYVSSRSRTFPLSKCSSNEIELATARLSETILALAETFVRGDVDVVSPIDLDNSYEEQKVTLLKKNFKTAIENEGVVLPTAPTNSESLEVLKCRIHQNDTKWIPDPMLLLVKAAINWSWRHKQKLLPACGSVHSEKEEERSLAAPSTPIPSFIELASAIPVTPDDDDDDW
jgi:hypothetical protein